MVLSTISHGPHLLITRVVSFSRHHASGRGCKERQNTTVGADVCPSKLVDLETNLPFEQSTATSSGLHLGHLFFVESYFVHLFMFLLLSGILLRVVQIPLNVLKNSGQVSGVLNHSQLGPSLALYLLCL